METREFEKEVRKIIQTDDLTEASNLLYGKLNDKFNLEFILVNFIKIINDIYIPKKNSNGQTTYEVDFNAAKSRMWNLIFLGELLRKKVLHSVDEEIFNKLRSNHDNKNSHLITPKQDEENSTLEELKQKKSDIKNVLTRHREKIVIKNYPQKSNEIKDQVKEDLILVLKLKNSLEHTSEGNFYQLSDDGKNLCINNIKKNGDAIDQNNTPFYNIQIPVKYIENFSSNSIVPYHLEKDISCKTDALMSKMFDMKEYSKKEKNNFLYRIKPEVTCYLLELFKGNDDIFCCVDPLVLLNYSKENLQTIVEYFGKKDILFHLPFIEPSKQEEFILKLKKFASKYTADFVLELKPQALANIDNLEEYIKKLGKDKTKKLLPSNFEIPFSQNQFVQQYSGDLIIYNNNVLEFAKQFEEDSIIQRCIFQNDIEKLMKLSDICHPSNLKYLPAPALDYPEVAKLFLKTFEKEKYGKNIIKKFDYKEFINPEGVLYIMKKYDITFLRNFLKSSNASVEELKKFEQDENFKSIIRTMPSNCFINYEVTKKYFKVFGMGIIRVLPNEVFLADYTDGIRHLIKLLGNNLYLLRKIPIEFYKNSSIVIDEMLRLFNFSLCRSLLQIENPKNLACIIYMSKVLPEYDHQVINNQIDDEKPNKEKLSNIDFWNFQKGIISPSMVATNNSKKLECLEEWAAKYFVVKNGQTLLEKQLKVPFSKGGSYEEYINRRQIFIKDLREKLGYYLNFNLNRRLRNSSSHAKFEEDVNSKNALQVHDGEKIVNDHSENDYEFEIICEPSVLFEYVVDIKKFLDGKLKEKSDDEIIIEIFNKVSSNSKIIELLKIYSLTEDEFNEYRQMVISGTRTLSQIIDIIRNSNNESFIQTKDNINIESSSSVEQIITPARIGR